MNSALAFLKHVLPSDGYYVATTIKSNGVKFNTFYDSIDRLGEAIIETDRRGLTVYHACGTFRVASQNSKNVPFAERVFGRTVANCRAAKSFWLDVDAGEGKPYADALDAFEHVQAFLRSTSLPPPVYVGSGGGLHLYWPLAADLGVEDWLRYARGLKQLCQREGLEIDPTRATDLASILRTPGTHNRKHGRSVEVQCGELVGPYPIETFKGLLNGHAEVEARVEGKRPALAGALADSYSDDPRYAAAVASQCAQVRRLRDSAGQLPEPLWYAALGVVGYCIDGAELGHEWSSPYDGYTFEETQGRLDRARALSGATTCEKFHSLDAKTCEACPHWGKIKSPISLGYTQSSALISERARTTNIFRESLAQTGSETNQTTNIFGTKTESILSDLPQLPHDFFWSKDRALVTKSEGKGGNALDIVISSYPIYLDAVQTGEIRGEWTFILKQFIPERGWFSISIGAKTLFGPAAAGELADRGANVHEQAHFIRYVRAAIDMYYKGGLLTTRYDQFGWKADDTAFLYGLDLYGDNGIKRVVGNDELQIRCKEDWIGPCKGGEIEGWKQSINSLFALGCEPQSVALLASFAAPLMRFQERDEGGAIIHLVTRESGTGKSTALIGAASVWGRREGLGLTNDDTKVTKALTLGALGNLPVIHDELTIRDPEAIRAFVINFTNGRDKMRATRAGEIKHSASTWQTILISAANSSLIDALSLQNDPEAASMRIMEFPLELPEGLRHVQGDKLRRALRENSGHAGRVYLDWLVHNLPWTRQTLALITEQTWAKTGLDAKYRFWVRTIAAIGVAGVIVKKLGLIEFSVERIMAWLFDQIASNAHMTNTQWAMSALAEFLNQHRDSTLAVARPFSIADRGARPLLEPRQKLLIRYELSTQRYCIAATALREWLIGKDRSYRDFVKSLEEEGVVSRRQAQITLGAGTDLPGGQVWCLEINGAHEKLAGVAPVKAADNVVAIAR